MKRMARAVVNMKDLGHGLGAPAHESAPVAESATMDRSSERVDRELCAHLHHIHASR